MLGHIWFERGLGIGELACQISAFSSGESHAYLYFSHDQCPNSAFVRVRDDRVRVRRRLRAKGTGCNTLMQGQATQEPDGVVNCTVM